MKPLLKSGPVLLAVALPSGGNRRDTPHVPAQGRGHFRGLATHLADADCELEQVKRVGDFAVYHRTKAGRCRGYELVRVRRHEARQTPFGFIEAHESYPTANAWEKDGISIPDRDEALERLGESARIGTVASMARMATMKGKVAV